MVSGGPYGLEELVGRAGYAGALLVIVLTPILWSLPTALMVSELSAALPDEGGYYAWVKRALGPFLGFKEPWLSLTATIIDMAIYPTLFVHYLGRLWPAIHPSRGAASFVCGAAMIAVCTVWNLRGSRAVGWGAVGLTVLLLSPFVVFTLLAAALHPGAASSASPALSISGSGLVGALAIAMWNYMGWDNVSTVAGEVERPQRTYPLALLLTLVLVAATYAIPVAWPAGTPAPDPHGWDTGAWVDAGRILAGAPLAWAISAGGVVCGVGMFAALMLSYSRVPAALAKEGLLPGVLDLRDPQDRHAMGRRARLRRGLHRLVWASASIVSSSSTSRSMARASLWSSWRWPFSVGASRSCRGRFASPAGWSSPVSSAFCRSRSPSWRWRTPAAVIASLCGYGAWRSGAAGPLVWLLFTRRFSDAAPTVDGLNRARMSFAQTTRLSHRLGAWKPRLDAGGDARRARARVKC